jgi:hypothetical protein
MFQLIYIHSLCQLPRAKTLTSSIPEHPNGQYCDHRPPVLTELMALESIDRHLHLLVGHHCELGLSFVCHQPGHPSLLCRQSVLVGVVSIMFMTHCLSIGAGDLIGSGNWCGGVDAGVGMELGLFLLLSSGVLLGSVSPGLLPVNGGLVDRLLWTPIRSPHSPPVPSTCTSPIHIRSGIAQFIMFVISVVVGIELLGPMTNCLPPWSW